MSIHPRPCRSCKGAGEMERWVRATFAGGAVATPEECMEGVQRFLATDPDGIDVEFEVVDCPACDGSGEETVERMPPGVLILGPDGA